MNNLSGNAVSRVWIAADRIFKKQPKYLCDNEWYALRKLQPYGIVPLAARIDEETIVMEILKSEPVLNQNNLYDNADFVLQTLKEIGLRHGDLTRPHVFVVNDKLKIIDWAESRVWDDPRPDKRREGDRWWLVATIVEILNEQE